MSCTYFDNDADFLESVYWRSVETHANIATWPELVNWFNTTDARKIMDISKAVLTKAVFRKQAVKSPPVLFLFFVFAQADCIFHRFYNRFLGTVQCADKCTANLARYRHWQTVHKFDYTRIFICRGAVANMVL